MTATDLCTCSHGACTHHYSSHLGHKGRDGRGKCAVHRCPCTSYEPSSGDSWEDVARLLKSKGPAPDDQEPAP